ncbi:hypothetical protein EVAR_39151_1 [Eumeta japonica]|uniref:Uncharacterized protein n=1 Tax=Eumeta variegata TaxID=151549 RepID=A0A4C1X9Y1_EUMVA|nr:hypothetical protein EVAR_39151_1 [Eumeta japonica]
MTGYYQGTNNSLCSGQYSTAVLMANDLTVESERTWRGLRGARPEVFAGARFMENGINLHSYTLTGVSSSAPRRSTARIVQSPLEATRATRSDTDGANDIKVKMAAVVWPIEARSPRPKEASLGHCVIGQECWPRVRAIGYWPKGGVGSPRQRPSCPHRTCSTFCSSVEVTGAVGQVPGLKPIRVVCETVMSRKSLHHLGLHFNIFDLSDDPVGLFFLGKEAFHDLTYASSGVSCHSSRLAALITLLGYYGGNLL